MEEGKATRRRRGMAPAELFVGGGRRQRRGGARKEGPAWARAQGGGLLDDGNSRARQRQRTARGALLLSAWMAAREEDDGRGDRAQGDPDSMRACVRVAAGRGNERERGEEGEMG